MTLQQRGSTDWSSGSCASPWVAANIPLHSLLRLITTTGSLYALKTSLPTPCTLYLVSVSVPDGWIHIIPSGSLSRREQYSLRNNPGLCSPVSSILQTGKRKRCSAEGAGSKPLSSGSTRALSHPARAVAAAGAAGKPGLGISLLEEQTWLHLQAPARNSEPGSRLLTSPLPQHGPALRTVLMAFSCHLPASAAFI